MLNRDQQFFILNPDTALIIGEKKRNSVHREGDWHQATNAFIVRQSADSSVEILVQERSKYVDIGKEKLDQSLATQLIIEDKNSPKRAILRGLKEELGIEKTDIARIEQFNAKGSFKIAKSYLYNKDLWNREIVTTFVVVLKNSKDLFTRSIKVRDVNWINWHQFCDLVQIEPNKFTKTARMFCIHEKMIGELENFFQKVLNNKSIKLLNQEIHYFSYYFNDISVFKDGEERYGVMFYETRNSMKQVAIYSKVKHIPFSFLRERKVNIFNNGYLNEVTKNFSQ